MTFSAVPAGSKGGEAFSDGCEFWRNYLFEVQETRCSVADLDIQKCVSTFKKMQWVPLDKQVCLRVPLRLLKDTSEGCF